MCVLIFFFKQKTAYEMRISDWSSDVCSSDLIIMTDKATVELTSPVAGRVTAAHGDPGQQLAVGSPLVEFEVEGAGNASAEATPALDLPARLQIGRASCRERVCQYV